MDKNTLTVIKVGLLFASGFYFFLVSIYGFGRSGTGGYDSTFLYVAGITWLDGLNPYDPASRIASIPSLAAQVYAFAYPPQIYPLAVVLAWFDVRTAWYVMIGLDLLSIIVFLWLSNEWLFKNSIEKDGHATKLWLPILSAILLTFPFLSHTVFLGQTSVIVVAALMLGWHFRQRTPWVAGLMFAVASIKPQLSAFVLLWVLLECRWRVCGWTTFFILVFSVVPLIASGPYGVVTSWISEIQAYRSSHFNSWGFRHMFGVPNVLHKFGLPTGIGWPLGFAATLLTWRLRGRFKPIETVALLLAYSLLFCGAHDYDLVGLAPAIVVIYYQFRVAAERWTILAVFLLAALYVPQRWLRTFESPIMLEYRVICVISLTCLLFYWGLRRDGRAPVLRSTADS